MTPTSGRSAAGQTKPAAIATELAPDAPELVAVAAGEELLRRIAAALAGEQRIVLESTLAGRTLRHVIGNARDTGFKITIVYLFLDSADMCVERVHDAELYAAFTRWTGGGNDG